MAGGDKDMALASALALKHNHIAWGKRRVAELAEMLKTAKGDRQRGGAA